jgi:hypothetical protein
MANRVDIDIYANDHTGTGIKGAKSKIDGLKSGFESLTGISLTTAGLIAAAGVAIGKAVDYTKEAVKETVTYNEQISELSRITGSSLEDTSRLIQVAQDMGIEYKDLATGLGNATKNGVDTSIESLLSLGEEYKKLETPMDRAKWLTENFGAAGRDLEPIFAASTESIIADMEEVSDALVWDDEKAQAVKDYESALGDLKQSFTELKITVGMEVLPVITEFIDILNGKGKISLGSSREEVRMLQEKYSGLAGTAGSAATAVDTTNESLGRVPGMAGPAAGAIGDVANMLNGINSKTATITVRGVIEKSAYEAQAFAGQGSRNPYIGLPANMRAVGGAVAPNVPYLVGENGPEIFKPNAAGSIIPNGQISDYSGGGGMDYDRMARAFIEALERSSLVR